jgi:hypothetical protein
MYRDMIRTTYEVGRVVSVTRDGTVKRVELPVLRGIVLDA